MKWYKIQFAEPEINQKKLLGFYIFINDYKYTHLLYGLTEIFESELPEDKVFYFATDDVEFIRTLSALYHLEESPAPLNSSIKWIGGFSKNTRKDFIVDFLLK